MKRLAVSAIVLMLALSLSACVINPYIRAVPSATVHTGLASASPAAAGDAPSADLTNQIGSGTIGVYTVKIVGFELVKDGAGEGDPAVVVTYEWTNNSDKTAGFTMAIQDKVCQAGNACSATTLTGDDTFDFDSILTDIEPGATQTVQRIYKLNDTASAIDIEVSALPGTETAPATVKQTYEIE